VIWYSLTTSKITSVQHKSFLWRKLTINFCQSCQIQQNLNPNTIFWPRGMFKNNSAWVLFTGVQLCSWLFGKYNFLRIFIFSHLHIFVDLITLKIDNCVITYMTTSLISWNDLRFCYAIPLWLRTLFFFEFRGWDTPFFVCHLGGVQLFYTAKIWTRIPRRIIFEH